jgi:hypothetical protein
MPFNISNFKSNLEDYGYLKNNHFQVSLRPPTVIRGGNNVANQMRFRAESVKVPGISILSADISRYGAGPTQKQPYSAQFGENSISILCDKNGEIWNFWYNWTQAIFQFNGNISSVPSYLTDYKDNYSTTTEIIMYDQEGNPVRTIDMFQSFPTSISDVSLNWGSSELIKLNIGMTYSSYTIV